MNVQPNVDSESTGCTRSQSMIHKRHIKGFSLIELMVVIAIVAILSTISIPLMRDWYIYNSVRSKASEIASLFDLARASAMETSNVVAMRGFKNPNDKYTTPSDRGDSAIIIIPQEFNGNNGSVDPQKIISELVPENIQVYLNSKDKKNNSHDVIFLPNGMSGYAADKGSRFIKDSAEVEVQVCGINGKTVYVSTITVGVAGAVNIVQSEEATSPCNGGN